MMRLLKVFSVLIVVLAAGLFAAAVVMEYMEQDETLPQITAESDSLEISCTYTQEELLEGVTAYDGSDGDLTDQIIVGDFSRFIDPGVCDLTYAVFDSAEHMATLTRRVIFTDYHSPQFGLKRPLTFQEGTTTNTEVRGMFTASDVLDGDLTDWIAYVETNAYYDTPGDYTITLEVRNSFGDTVSYAFPIHIYADNSQNVEIRLSQGLVYVAQGGQLNPADYVESVSGLDGRQYSASELQIDAQVDTATPGLYEVQYTYEDDSGWYGQTWLTVIVQEVGG